jgi:hypothetical protein
MGHGRKWLFSVFSSILLASSLAAGSASAAAFHTSVANVQITGVQTENHTFIVQGSESFCRVGFQGKAAGINFSALNVNLVFEQCTAFGFASATVNVAGCHYVFAAETTLGAGTEASANLESCTGGHATISSGVPFIAACEVQVPNQTGINGHKYVNRTIAGQEVIETVTHSTNLEVNVTKSTGLCPLTVGKATMSQSGTTTATPATGNLWWK